MSAQPLSLREETELRSEVAGPEGAGYWVTLTRRLLATLDEARREREAALTALRAEEQRNGLVIGARWNPEKLP